MLENASRQLFLVLLAIAAGIVCCVLFKVPLGFDLKGGTQLRYEVPADVVKDITSKENVSVDAIMEQTIGVIHERIDPTGTLDPTITRSGELGILIELPYFTDKLEEKRVIERVANLGHLEMRIVADKDYMSGNFSFNMQMERARLEGWLRNEENKKLLLEDPRNIRRFNEDANGPLAVGNIAWYPRLVGPHPKQYAPEHKDRWDYSFTGIPELAPATVKLYTDAEWNGGVIPEAVRKKPVKEQFLIELIALNMHERHFTGKDLDPNGVSAGTARDGGLAVNYSVVPGLTSDYGAWSEQYKGKCSAIVLNGLVKSAPVFRDRIPGYGQISGGFTKEEVDELVKVLRAGSLRVEPEMQSNESIGPNLGREAIVRGMWSLIAGSVLVFAFMLWYYGVAGTIACVTLVLNVFLLWACMLFMQATITLPGLGGIVLTLGMAVDANVLIYERIREELAKGKDLLRSVRAGFERAMSAILDSNITTFLVGLVLFNVGVGPVRGFAVTLMVGIVTTVFTQFFVTRLLFHFALEKNWLVNYKPRSLFTNLNVDFVKHIGKCVTISSAIIVAGLIYATFVAPREVTLGIDFTGGANLHMVLSQSTTAENIRARLENDAAFAREYPNVSVNTVGKADASGEYSRFNMKFKLRDAQREQAEAGRKAWRDLRAAALAADQPPPPAYEPPYVLELRRVFGNELVQPAFSDALTTPYDNDAQKNLQYAQIDLHFQKPLPVEDVRKALGTGLSRSTITPIGDPTATMAKDLRVEWTTQSSYKSWQLFPIVQKELERLPKTEDGSVVLSDPFPEAQEIQGRLVNDLRNAAIGALVLAWVLIVFYLRIRFHEYKYGVAAVVALIHDVLVTFVVVVFCNHLGLVHAEINLSMIACFLTIIGYSVNDTIVIFDRIRENVTDNARVGAVEPFRALINRALNQTMSRTLLTSGLTLLTVIAQFAVNFSSQSDLASFAFAMIIGMVSGVYSTVYIAAPVLIWMHKDAPAGSRPAAATAATGTPANTPAV